MSPEEMRDLVYCYVKAYNNLDVEGMLRTVHADVEFKNIVNGEVNASTRGIEALRTLAEHSKTLFSARTQTIVALELRADEATADLTFRATLANDLSDGLRKGQQLNLTGQSEFRFRDGLIDRIVDIS